MKKTKVVFTSDKLKTSTELMRALAHPLRLRILEYIDQQGSTNVNKIYRSLGIEQSITSQHLRIMRMAGVLDSDRDGKYVHYSINYPIVQRAKIAVDRFLSKEHYK